MISVQVMWAFSANMCSLGGRVNRWEHPPKHLKENVSILKNITWPRYLISGAVLNCVSYLSQKRQNLSSEMWLCCIITDAELEFGISYMGGRSHLARWESSCLYASPWFLSGWERERLPQIFQQQQVQSKKPIGSHRASFGDVPAGLGWSEDQTVGSDPCCP